ncbi:helix-turn-helix transcriptional regulator [Affinibrenneria salicis]|uniref:Helix-turn-helix transcriptional regulator n=1 Tax=Affinibrenneria salicis TaxID=2590031 RepID=A0A5J5FRM3_9GAMM|nr:helix-turn-helix domain-containing protein [Affinibrenneria salicis]KAA8995398.1 helix-turn-helix transcriptional regulator [Affinibrenneria salicis]
MINPSSLVTDARHFSVEDFLGFGERYGIAYRFPTLSSAIDRHKEKRIVVQGAIEEMTLASGLCLTSSSVRVLQSYESTSLQVSPLYVLVVIEGCVAIRLGGRQYVVRPGMALCTRLGQQLTLSASQMADQHLNTLTLAINPATFRPDPALKSLLHAWARHSAGPASVWPLPGYLLCGIQQTLTTASCDLARRMMLEGLMLQLLAHCLPPGAAAQEKSHGLSPGEQRRLESVRQLLQQQPEKDHALPELARAAAMSSSSLRTKFRQSYGQSVFDYLRDCRLNLARRYLQQGYSVQQAAWLSGYQHATNFATAFRRRYGISPSAIRENA